MTHKRAVWFNSIWLTYFLIIKPFHWVKTCGKNRKLASLWSNFWDPHWENFMRDMELKLSQCFHRIKGAALWSLLPSSASFLKDGTVRQANYYSYYSIVSSLVGHLPYENFHPTINPKICSPLNGKNINSALYVTHIQLDISNLIRGWQTSKLSLVNKNVHLL